MQSFRKNFLIVTGLLVMAASVSAFIAKPAADKPAIDMYWYNVSADGLTVSSYIGPTAPSCDEPDGDYCALGFQEEDIQNPGSSTPVLKSAAQSTPLSYKDDERHKL